MENYMTFVTDLLDQNKTTGSNQSEDMIHYTKMNLKRLLRWQSKGIILDETKDTLAKIKEKQTWILITEAWCGDAAHSFQFIEKMAAHNEHITFKWLLRDENLELMDQYLTNGGRSIPKLIVRNEARKDLFDWVPRPVHIQEAYLAMRLKEMPYSEINIELQKLYNKDKGATLQKELIQKIEGTLS